MNFYVVFFPPAIPFCLYLCWLFKFIHANVSLAFISIRDSPYIYVYPKLWFSFALPKNLSISFFGLSGLNLLDRWDFGLFWEALAATGVESSSIKEVSIIAWFVRKITCDFMISESAELSKFSRKQSKVQ